MLVFRRLLATLLLAFLASTLVFGQAQVPSDLRSKVDQVVQTALADTGVPSVSVAIVIDGKLAYANAYGFAKLDPKTPARPDMRYSIGSVSKQFTAAAILKLQEEGKLSLDDKVAKFLPNLTRANEVTIRQLLSHTSGYSDFWPQDYVPPFMNTAITPEKIMEMWATKPLDFDPGTQWQYSNTGFVIAGRIVEKASGQPFMTYLQQKILGPVGIKNAYDTDQQKLPEADPSGYLAYALATPRPAPKEGKGWMYAAGELAMTAEDLARWNTSMLNQSLLKPASYREMTREVQLTNGLGSRYGLGIAVTSESGRRALEHGGEVSGFTAENIVYPDDRVAISVLANQDATHITSDIARDLAPFVFEAADPSAAKATTATRAIFEGLQRGTIERSLFTPNCNDYFSEAALADFKSSLGPLGQPSAFTQIAKRLRGGMTLRRYRVTFPREKIIVWTYTMPDGKIEQYQVAKE
jgi:D-alanyl-D-alanine carboxypeptidase